MLLLAMLFQIPALPPPWDQIMVFLGPIFTFLIGTFVVPWIRGRVNDLWILGVVVPILAVLVYIVQYFIGLPTVDVWIQIALNLLAVFLSQFQKKLQETRAGG